MTQDKASQFQQLVFPLPKGTYECKRCGALVLDREQHLAWHLLLLADFNEVADWLNPGEL